MKKFLYNKLDGRDSRQNERGRESKFHSSATAKRTSRVVVTFMTALLMALCNAGAFAQNISQTTTYEFPDAEYGYTQAPVLTVTITNSSTIQSFNLSMSGGLSGSFELSTSTTESVAVNGTTTFTVKPISGLSAGNYFTRVYVTDGSSSAVGDFRIEFEVTPKPITYTGITASRIYNGGGAAITGTDISTSSAQTEDIVGTDNVALNASGASVTPSSANAGDYSVTGSGFTITGPQATNYTLVQPTVAVTINRRVVTLSGVTYTATKEYDGTKNFTADQITASGTLTLAGVVSAEATSVVLNMDNAAVTVSSANVGTYSSAAVTGFALSGNRAFNYSLTQPTVSATISQLTAATADVAKLLSLTPANLTYNGSPQAITDVSKKISGLGEVTPNFYYTGTSNDGTAYASATPPVNAGDYAITVDIGASTNNVAVTLSVPFTIKRVTPTLADLVIDPALADGIAYYSYVGMPRDLIATPTLKRLRTGLGAVTLSYNGKADLPVDPGTYTVTAVIAQGANYTAATIGLGELVITELPAPIVRRKVTLEVSEYFTSDPAPGEFHVISGSSLTITLTPRASLPEGYEPTVSTSRRIIKDEDGGVRVTPNEDGTYTVLIGGISEETVVTVDANGTKSNNGGGTGNVNVSGATRVWSYGRQLYLEVGTNSGQANIYNVSGVLQQALPFVSGETLTVTLPTGIYLVSTGKQVFKVVINN